LGWAESPDHDRLDGASKLHPQDEAFSLVLEAYREVQGSFIEADYDSLIRAGSGLRDNQVRHAVAVLADLERDLRSDALLRKVKRLEATYEYAHRMDEREAGVHVPNTADYNAVTVRLAQFHPMLFAELAPPVISEAPMSTPTISRVSPISSTPVPDMALPTRFRNPLTLLRRCFPKNDALFQIVALLVPINRPSLDEGIGPEPILFVATYHQHENVVTDVVVMAFNTLGGSPERLQLKAAGRTRLEHGELLTPVENWLRLITTPSISWFGADEDTVARKRAFDQLLQGDPTFLREQTVEPLHIAAVLSEPGLLLPGSIRTRVRAIAAKAELAFDHWQCETKLISANLDDAGSVAGVLTSWRAMASSVVDVYSENGSKKSAQKAMSDSSIEAIDDTIVVRASVPGNLGTRAVCKLLRLAGE
jgi:hypothetical protein